MNQRHTAKLRITAGTLALAVMLAAVTFAQRPSPVVVNTTDQTGERLEVRYARAHLRLAELDLQRYEEERQRHPQRLPMVVSEQLKRHVAIDKEQLRQAMKGSDADPHQIHLQSARIAVELAEADLDRKRDTYRELSGPGQAWDVKRAEAVLEVANLNLEIVKAQDPSLSSLTYLQWQIDDLRNQLLEVQVQQNAKIPQVE